MAINEVQVMVPGDEGMWHRERWEDYMQARNTTHEEWFNNSATLYGDPFVVWDDLFKMYVDRLHGYRYERVLFDLNTVSNIMEARDGFITGEGATVYVHNKTDQTIGRQRADLAQRVARAYWDENKMWTKFLDAREYCKWTGNAYIRIYYHPGLGKKIKGTNLNAGKVMAQVLSPYQVAVDPLADEWDRIKHLYIASIVPIEDVEGRYTDIDWAEALKDSEKTAWVSQHERYLQAQKPEQVNVRDIKDRRGRPRNVLKLEYFEKPTEKHPQGRYQVIFGQKVAVEKPLETGTIPVVWFYDKKVAGTLIAKTPLSKMVPLQEALNRLASLCLEHAQMPDVYSFPESLGWPDEPRKFAGKAFIVGTHRSYGSGSGAPPVILQSGQVRQDYILLFDMYKKEIESLAGVESISARGRPPYQMSGRMGYIVTDASKRLLGKISFGFKQSCDETMRLILSYISKFYTDERTASFINERDMREVVRYKGTDIGTDYTLDVSLGANLMDDPLNVAQMTLQYLSIPLIAQQVMANPIALKKATEAINPELAQKMFSSEQDTGVAEDENFEIRQGGTPPVLPHQNDDVHLREHTRQRNSDEIREWSPTAVRYLDIHMEQHEQQKMAKISRQAMMMNMFTMGQGAMTSRGRTGGERPSGSPGVAPPQQAPQTIDTALERQTVQEFPGAPKPGGG